MEWCPSGTSGPRGFGVEVRSGRGGVVGGVDPLLVSYCLQSGLTFLVVVSPEYEAYDNHRH